MNAALAQLRDKMDPMYIISNDPSGSHIDAHVKKNVGHLVVGHQLFLRIQTTKKDDFL